MRPCNAACCKLRRQCSDAVVDKALAAWQQQRDAVAITKQKQERGPQQFRKDRLANL
jgi:hypothetical protein